nr:MAG TPA: hypothetical protein [Caudoviricetes sp.]
MWIPNFLFFVIKSLPKITYHKNFRDSLTTVFLFCLKWRWKIGEIDN